MLTHSEIAPGISLSCIQDHRFKHSAMTFQYLRPMCGEEAAMNALIPSVLLRGCKSAPDLRRITQRLDDLCGASVSPISRRAGNCQTTGLYLSLMDDRFAPEGEALTEQAIAFLKELLFDYPTEQGGFLPDFVEGEKTNQIYAIEAEYNDKQTYCSRQLLKSMCREDPFGVPRLGEPADVEAITPQGLLRHYEKVRRESPVEVLYVGSAAPERMEMLVRQLFAGEDRSPAPLNADAPLHSLRPGGPAGKSGHHPGEALHGLCDPRHSQKRRFSRHAAVVRRLRRRCHQQAVSERPGKAEPLLFHRRGLLQRQGDHPGIRRYGF